MTLVELLVVVAILGLLAVTVLPNFSATQESRQAREAAQIFSAFVSQAQARSYGSSAPQGFTITPLSATGYAATDLSLVRSVDPYRGDSVNARLLVTVSGTIATGTTSNPADLATLSGTIVHRGDRIRFNNTPPTYLITGAVTGPSVPFSFRAANGNSNANNTPWPIQGIPLAFEIFRRPIAFGIPTSLPYGRAVDLRWSGVLDSSGVFHEFFTTPPVTEVAILFTSNGAVEEVTVGGLQLPHRGRILLLLGRADRAGQPMATLNPDDDSVGANWQYSNSFWLSLDPGKGNSKITECGAITTGTTVIDSMEFIRD